MKMRKNLKTSPISQNTIKEKIPLKEFKKYAWTEE
jgi:hypothetical protein